MSLRTSAPVPKSPLSSSLIPVGLGGAVGFLMGRALREWWRARISERRNPPQGQFIEVDGVRLHYLDSGGSGLPVLLFHGNGTMAEDFRSSGLFQALAKTNRVVAFDRPGFGYSERPRNRIWSPTAQAQLLNSAADALDIDRSVVVGHSWGTLVALAFASEHPERVQGVVAISGYYFPSFRWDAVASIGGALPVIGDVIHYTLSPALGRRFLRAALRKQFSPRPIASAFVERFPLELMLRPWQMRASAAESAFMVPAAAALGSTRRRLKLLQIPVFIIAGEGDEIVDSRKQSARLGDELPNSFIRIVPGVGHMLHYSASEAIVEAVRLAAGTDQQQRR